MSGDGTGDGQEESDGFWRTQTFVTWFVLLHFARKCESTLGFLFISWMILTSCLGIVVAQSCHSDRVLSLASLAKRVLNFEVADFADEAQLIAKADWWALAVVVLK